MKLKVLFLLTGNPGFEISINDVAVPPEYWEGWSPRFSYTLNCDSGQRLHIRRHITGKTGDHISLRISLEEWDLELGTYPLTIEQGTGAEDSFTVVVPGPMFRMRTEDTFSIDEAEPEGTDGTAATGITREEAFPPSAPQAPVPRWQSAKPGAVHQDEDSGNYEVEVYYATDRNAVTKGDKLGFGQERSKLQYGKCLVNIPRNKALGELPRPVWWKLQFRENPDKHVMVLETAAREKDDFFAELKDTVANATSHDAFVFIHGYNVAFDEAAWRTAQIAYDTGFGGAPIMYSWPSRASVEGYFSDEDNVQYSHQSIVQFIRDVKERSGAQKLHLIAHSMGNRALAAALVSLHESGYFKETCFNQIILAAPDIDAQIFINDIAPNLAGCSSRVTLYASSKDKALLASRRLRENLRRAGDGGEAIVCCPGIDTIDASTVDTDLLGHGYFAATETLLHDITALLQSGKAPDERHLRPVKYPDRSYWSF